MIIYRKFGATISAWWNQFVTESMRPGTKHWSPTPTSCIKDHEIKCRCERSLRSNLPFGSGHCLGLSPRNDMIMIEDSYGQSSKRFFDHCWNQERLRQFHSQQYHSAGHF